MSQRTTTDWERLHREVEAGTMSTRWSDEERLEAQLYAQMLFTDAQRHVMDALAEVRRRAKYLSDSRLFFDRYPIVEARHEQS